MAFYTDFPVYPTEILDTTDYPDQADNVDDVLADLVNALRDEVIAVQAELGTLPKAGYADVSARLDSLGTPSVIQDSDGDTSWDTEETADKDEIRGKVAGVEFFRGHGDGIITLAKQSGARAYRTTSEQVIGTASWTKIQLNGESYDTQGELDTAINYRFTAKKAGYYIVVGSVRFKSAPDGTSIGVGVLKNGVAAPPGLVYSVTAIGAAENISFQCTNIISLAVNDYVDLWAYQNSGGNLNIDDLEQYTFLCIHKLS